METILPHFFLPRENFQIRVEEKDAEQIYTIYQNDKLCVKLIKKSGEEDKIHIDNINKCTPGGKLGSGTDNINRLKNFADETGYKLIIDTDVSKKYEFLYDGKYISGVPLGGLYILSTGQSWYNSLGFLDKGFYGEGEETGVYEKTMDYITNHKIKFTFTNKEVIKSHFTEIRDFEQEVKNLLDKIDSGKKESVQEIFKNVHSLLELLSRNHSALNEEQLKIKAQLLGVFTKKINSLITDMTKKNVFQYYDKFLNLEYVPHARGEAAVIEETSTVLPQKHKKTKKTSTSKQTYKKRRISSSEEGGGLRHSHRRRFRRRRHEYNYI